MQTFTFYKTNEKSGYSHTIERSFEDHEVHEGLPPIYSGETLTPPPLAPSGMIAVLERDGGDWELQIDNTQEPYYLDGVNEALYLHQYGQNYPEGALAEPPLAFYLALLDEERATHEDVVLTIDGVEYQYNRTEHLKKVLQSHTIKHGTVTQQSHTSPDGTRHLLSAEEHSAVTMELGLYESEVSNRDRELYEELVAANDMSTVDLASGWPDTVRTTN